MIGLKEIVEKYGTEDCKNIKYNIADEKYYKKLYKKIRAGEAIDFSFTYFDGFSLSGYRKKYNLLESEPIQIYFIGSFYSIFDGRKFSVDLSNIQFIPCDEVAGTAFDNSIFLGGIVNYYGSTFSNKDITFDSCRFIDCNFKFPECSEIKDLSFSNIIKSNSDFLIYEVKAQGDISLSKINVEVEYGSLAGDIIVEKCDFSETNFFFNNNRMSTDKDCVLFIDNIMSVKRFSFYDSYQFGLIFYNNKFNTTVTITDCGFKYFILQECVLQDVFKIVYEEVQPLKGTKFCFLNSVFNGFFDIDAEVLDNTMIGQKKFFIDYSKSYDEERFIMCDTSYLEKSVQIKNLSEIFSENGKFDKEDELYSLSRRYRNLYRVEENINNLTLTKRINKSNRCWLYLKYSVLSILSGVVFLIEYLLLDLVCGNYATKPTKFLFWLCFIIASFAFIMVGNCDINGMQLIVELPPGLSHLSKAIIVSFTNFFQIELVDVYYDYWLYLVSGIEKVVGMVILAIFTVSYTRKIIK